MIVCLNLPYSCNFRHELAFFSAESSQLREQAQFHEPSQLLEQAQLHEPTQLLEQAQLQESFSSDISQTDSLARSQPSTTSISPIILPKRKNSVADGNTAPKRGKGSIESQVLQAKSLMKKLEPDERERAFKLFESARRLGSVEALGHVCLCLFNGGKQYGVERDRAQALELARLGAERSPPVPLCLTVLGWCHLFGYGVANDENVGVRYLRKAVDMKCPVAMEYLGKYYSMPQVSCLDEALKLFRQSKSLDHAPAMTQLGIFYLYKCFPPKPDQAMQQFLEAVKHGDVEAHMKLADYYDTFATPPNPEYAKKLRLMCKSLLVA
jgi:TPR repeat protein